MQDDPPPQPAQPLDYAKPADFPKRTSVWIWIGLACLVIVLLLLAVPIFFPNSRSWPVANRIKSASNLRQIGQAILLYTNDFQGQYPATFGDLLLHEDITSAVFVSPSSSDLPAAGPTTQATITNLSTPGHCSYIYLGKGLTTQTQQPTMVIAYERPAINKNQGGNVLFGDGHVEFDTMPDLNSIQNQITAGIWPVYLPAQPAATHPSARAPLSVDLTSFQYKFDADHGTINDIPQWIRDLDGRDIVVEGYMVPKGQQESITHFYLLPKMLNEHEDNPLQQLVVCKTPPGKALSYFSDRLRVQGKIHIGIVKDQGIIDTLYTLDATSVQAVPTLSTSPFTR